jgi:hypothetical protein
MWLVTKYLTRIDLPNLRRRRYFDAELYNSDVSNKADHHLQTFT